MKKIIILIIIVGGLYLLYSHYIAEPQREVYEATESLSEAGLRARQNEARQLLRLAYQKQESYHALHGRYTRKFDDLKIQDRGTYYKLEIKAASIKGFEIRAEGNIDNDSYLDVWVVDQNGSPYNLVDDVKKN
ncbi:MAG: type IV pilin protein [bacterium]